MYRNLKERNFETIWVTEGKCNFMSFVRITNRSDLEALLVKKWQIKVGNTQE